MSLRVLVPGLLRIAAAALVLGVFCYTVRECYFEGFVRWSFWWRLATLALAGAVAGLLYLIAAYFIRVPELTMFVGALSRRLRRP